MVPMLLPSEFSQVSNEGSAVVLRGLAGCISFEVATVDIDPLGPTKLDLHPNIAPWIATRRIKLMQNLLIQMTQCEQRR